uniref:Uncharacterized protein n=1 Tax=viral metagenome TaxID=1070528 RepID=A0A6C0LH95_9ZZZZ
MNQDRLINLKLQLLQDKTQRFSKENINKLRTHSELILALKKKYPMFFYIIENHGIQYKQFLSAFFLCILTGHYEPFSIKLEKETLKRKRDSKYLNKVYDIYSANYNYITLLPWNKYNIVKCYNVNKEFSKTSSIRINKEQFMQCVVVLFPKFIKKYPKLFFELNKKLEETNKGTISVIHLYKYLVYCGDKIAKDEYYNKSLKDKNKFKFSKNKIETFLRIFTYEQLINILV